MGRRINGKLKITGGSPAAGNVVATCTETYSNVIVGSKVVIPLTDGEYDFNLDEGRYTFTLENDSVEPAGKVVLGEGVIITGNIPMNLQTIVNMSSVVPDNVRQVFHSVDDFVSGKVNSGSTGGTGSTTTGTTKNFNIENMIITSNAGVNSTSLANAYGGTWANIGIQSVGQRTLYFFEKVSNSTDTGTGTGTGGSTAPVVVKPIANFTIDKTTGEAPADFVITNTSTTMTYPIVSSVLTFSNGDPSAVLNGSYGYRAEVPDQAITITLTVTDSYGNISAKSVVVTTTSQSNTPPVISNQTIVATVGSNIVITLGPLQDADGDLINYTFTGADGGVRGEVPSQIIFSNISIGNRNIHVIADDGNGGVTEADVTLLVTAAANGITNNYIMGFGVIDPDLSGGVPAKGVPFVDPTTGCTVTRVVDSSTDMQQSTQSMNGYSRYSQENSDGTLFLAQGANSTSSTILSRETGNVVAYLAYDDSGTNTHSIGMAHEMRWDKTGNHPNRMYFVQGTKFYMIDDVTQNNNVTRANPTRSVIKDFIDVVTWPAAAAGKSKKVYNDQEGDCSLDCDHWAFMAAYYDNSNWRCCAIIHYQISTDTVNIMYPSDLAGSNLDAFKNDPYFPKRPNMVEISPLASGIVIHTGRSWIGWNDSTLNTWFDGPFLWPLDFDWATTPPLKISIDETHSGWAWAEDGRELFVSQDNRRDRLIAVYITGENKGYPLPWNTAPSDDSGPGCIDFAMHIDLSWTGFHFSQMPRSKPGWIMVSTYSNGNKAMDDQLIMFQIKPLEENPVYWRICPMYSLYTGNYFDEAPGSINMDGTAIYISQNWGSGNTSSNELYRYDLPSDWLTHLNGGNTATPAPIYGSTIIVNGIEVL